MNFRSLHLAAYSALILGFWLYHDARSQTLEWTFVAMIGREGGDIGQMREPSGVAIDPVGNMYVADTGNHRIQQLDLNGRYIRHIGGFGLNRQQFNRPMGIDATGLDVFVTDTRNQRIHRLDRQLNFVGVVTGEITAGESPAHSFGFPRGIAVSPVGDIYFSDTDNDEIIKMNKSGLVELRFGGFSSGKGRLNHPAGLAVDHAGSMYVADTGHNRIAVFDTFGGYMKEIGRNELAAPEGVTIGGRGRVTVADTGRNRIVIFSAQGKMLLAFGARGPGVGSFLEPRDVAVDQTGHLFVADAGNHRIQKFKIMETGE